MKNRVLFFFVTTVIVWGFFAVPVDAQSKKVSSQSEISALKKELARLQSELDACKKTKNDAENTKRNDAIGSLNAIRSALGTGANLQEFKKYQIESRIKIDALPNTQENQIIKDISDIYRDAVVFGVVGLTGVVNNYDIETAQKKYSRDETLMKSIDDLTPNNSSRGLAHDINRICGKTISQLLILSADKKFSELK